MRATYPLWSVLGSLIAFACLPACETCGGKSPAELEAGPTVSATASAPPGPPLDKRLVQPVTPNALAEALPAAPAGWKADPPEAREQLADKQVRVAMAQRVYHAPAGDQHLAVTLIDARGYPAYLSLGTEKVDGVPAAESSDDAKHEETIRLAVADRFLVTVRTRNMPKGSARKLWSSVDVARLKKLAQP